jgi:hypothetical protein
MNDLIASASFTGRVFRGGARGEIYPVYKRKKNNVVESFTPPEELINSWKIPHH